MEKWIVYGSIYCLIIQAIAQIIGKPEAKRWTLAFLLLLGAYLQIHFLFFSNYELLNYPRMFMSYVPALLFLGPLLRLYFNMLSKDETVFKIKNVMHVLLPIWGLYEYLRSINISGDDLILHIEQLYQGVNLSEYYIYTIVCGASLLFYGFLILKEQPSIKKPDNILNKPVLLIWAIVNILFIIGMILGGFCVYFSLKLTYTGCLISSFVYTSIFIIQLRYPSILNNWLFEYRKSQRSRKYLGNIEPYSFLEDIKIAMINEGLFKDMDISLQSLADRFKLTRYQLSELLNDYANQSFHEFIAQYRVEFSKELLVSQSWKKNSEIGLESGFGSQAMFNKVFKKSVGVTPTQFQKVHVIKN